MIELHHNSIAENEQIFQLQVKYSIFLATFRTGRLPQQAKDGEKLLCKKMDNKNYSNGETGQDQNALSLLWSLKRQGQNTARS